MAKRTKTSKRQRQLIKQLHAKVQHLSLRLSEAQKDDADGSYAASLRRARDTLDAQPIPLQGRMLTR